MKNNNLYLIAILALSLSSCSKELDKININPNVTENAQPDYILTGAIKNTVDMYWGTTNNMNSSLLFTQQFAKVQYTEEERFIYSGNSFTSLWSTGYTQGVSAFNTLIKLGDAAGNPNYRGVGLVLRSWVFLLLTDAYGDVPYSQAGQLKQFVTPVYDKQKDIYFSLLDDLKAAGTVLDPAGKAIGGDVIYNGNILRWKKLANSLRLRIALRISDREPGKAKQIIDEIQAGNNLLLSEKADIAQLIYQNSPQQNPISAQFETREDYRVSKTIIDKLTELNDPRLAIYANKTQNPSAAGYVGLPNGLDNDGANAIGLANVSRPGAYFLQPLAPAVIFSYSELLFDRAEAAARGFTTENAAALYQQAIRASFAQYNLSDDAATAYLAQPAVQYDATNFKKSIGEQKWLALYGQGLEAWAERRRLDYPVLKASVKTVLDGQIPVRFIYPGTEQSLNGNSYKNAVASQGPDLLTTKLWFDVN